MFHPRAACEFADALEAQWREIRREYLGIRGELIDWLEPELYDRGWKVFGLFDFPHGHPIAANIAKCPVTAALIAQHVRRHGAAGFSVLEPRTRIRPHQGYAGSFLRVHLPLDIPAGDCGLRVGGETRRWETGTVMVFDDRAEHEAWNETDQERVVLLLDFIP